MKKVFITLPIILAGCSTDLPTAALSSAAATAQDNALSLDTQKKQTFSKLMTLKAENDTMCLRVQKQRAECPHASPLIPDDGEKVLACVSGVAADSIAPVEYLISVQPPAGTKIYLSTKGGAWRTNEVGAGTGQKLTWGPKAPDACNPKLRVNPANIQAQIRSPRLLELSELDVIIVPDDKSKCYSNENQVSKFGAFDVSVNGKPLFSKSDLSFNSGNHQINLSALDNYLGDAKCVVPLKELEALFAEAKTNVASPASPPPTALASVDADYARETGRNQSLRLALTGQEKLGCWAFAKIDKLEVKIDGAAVGRGSLGNGGQLKDEGNAKGYTFNFGRGITHAVAEENGIFKPGGGFITNAFAGREIQELNFLRISREGTSFDNEEFTTRRSCGFLGLGSCTDRSYRRYETNRRSMSSIKILVNDQVVYENPNVSFTFERGKLEWPGGKKVEKIQDNPKFRELMRQTTCPAG